MKTNRPELKILVAPLDWGLGHITRCIPIVNELVSNGCSVTIAAERGALALLKKEFPHGSFLLLKGYRIFYHNARNSFGTTIIRQIPGMMVSIWRERQWLKKIIEEYQFDIVISDNRYGLHTRLAHTVFITHQLGIKTGLGVWADRILRGINYRFIRKYDECWIPDFEGNLNLGGDLSHPRERLPQVRYIGPLSRLTKVNVKQEYDLVFVLSGPEPRRSLWEKALLKELEHTRQKVLFVRGLHEDANLPPVMSSVKIVNFLPSEELNTVIQQANWVICRSGYTSVMDLIQLQQKAILIPTPGQPEQEYLAWWLHKRKIFFTCAEDSFSLPDSLLQAARFSFDFCGFNPPFLKYKEVIRELISSKISI